MENISLTHRIVGAIVILSLAIIFIPLLLETDQINPGKISESPIPEIPEEIETIVFERNGDNGKFIAKNADEIAQFENSIKQEIESSVKEVELKEEVIKPASKPEPDKPTFPVIEDKPFEHTWMLQLASFKNNDKAISFRNRLRQAGYTAHINEKQFDNGSTLWRVRVGPYVRKEQAKIELAKMNKTFKVKGILVQRR